MAPRRGRTTLAPAEARAGDLAIDAEGLAPAEVARLLDARDRLLARHGLDRRADESRLRSFVRARIGATRIGIAIEAVAAVLPPVRAAPVPGAPAHLIGLFAHDGAIHNLFAVEAALGLPPIGPRGETAALALALRRPGPRIAIAIDEALDLVRIAPPEEDAAGDGPALRFVAGDEAGATMFVDVESLVAALGVTEGRIGEGKTN